MQVTIAKINRDKKDTKFGEKNSVGIAIEETTVKDVNGAEISVDGRWLNCLYDVNKNNGTESWDAGQKVDIDIKVNGQYLNFRPGAPTQNNDLEERVSAIEARLDKLDGGTVTQEEEISDPDF